MLDHNLAGDPLPHPRRSHHQARCYLVEIGSRCFRFLREIHGKARVKGGKDAHGLFHYPWQGDKREELVVWRFGIHLI